MTALEVKHKLWSEGKNLKIWAEENGYKYRTVSAVVSGQSHATYGLGYEIAVKLGMQTNNKKTAD
ncbi:MAG: DNA-binding protein [Oxalobacteraceae bacterium]|nr:DNA-binding protein [Oxalobacteraceae bacterium]